MFHFRVISTQLTFVVLVYFWQFYTQKVYLLHYHYCNINEQAVLALQVLKKTQAQFYSISYIWTGFNYDITTFQCFWWYHVVVYVSFFWNFQHFVLCCYCKWSFSGSLFHCVVPSIFGFIVQVLFKVRKQLSCFFSQVKSSVFLRTFC